ncbi:MAG: RDD family protein [Ferruginibacter sp.]
MQNELTEQDNDLLTSFESIVVPASTGKRFANYIIDIIVFYGLIFLIAVIFALLNMPLFTESENSTGFDFMSNILALLMYGIYMFIVEALFKGKSLGKLITGTRAVNLDGSRISVTTAMGRGFSRAVPFDTFSALGSPSNPWHDKWNKTMVMDEKLSTIVAETI